jgi:hypothetical protein
MSANDTVPGRTPEDLARALDRGSLDELPENRPPGWLGEVAPNMRKAEEFVPSVNAGLIQEDSRQMRWLLMLVLYLFVFSSPVALWLLWREPKRSLRAKVITTVVGLAGYVLLFLATSSLRPVG